MLGETTAVYAKVSKKTTEFCILYFIIILFMKNIAKYVWSKYQSGRNGRTQHTPRVF